VGILGLQPVQGLAGLGELFVKLMGNMGHRGTLFLIGEGVRANGAGQVRRLMPVEKTRFCRSVH